jgi:hypothetical protein
MKNVALISPGLHRGAAKVFTLRLDGTPDRAAILVLQVLENSSQRAF